MMDVAVPANMRIGLAQSAVAEKGWALLADEAMALVGRPDVALVDLREKRERERHGKIPGALHEPYTELAGNIGPGGLLRALGADRRVVFYCAYGERSAMAVQAAQEAGIKSACHIQGGIAAWKDAGGPIEH
jgi:rhodanese-related sulfurtransferase